SVTGMSGNGTVRAAISSGAAQDAAGNSSALSTSTDNIVTFDNVAPTVTINQAAGQADPTAAGPIQFTVVFSETVSGFNAADISLAGSTVGGTLVANVTGSGATYTLSVTGMSGTGTLRASVVASAALDAAGNPSAASTSTDNTVVFDNVRPTVTINQAPGQADPAATLPVNFAVVFSEPVNGFTAADVSFAGSTGSGTLTASVTGSGASYTVAVTGLSGPGTITASIPAGVATDAVGNSNLASTSTDNSVSVTLTIARPDLVTIHGFLPASVPVGGTVTVAEVTFNTGAAAAGASTTRYYLSPDPVWSTSDRLLASRSVGPLASGSFSLGPILNVVIPAGTVPGGYYLLAVADADRVIVESNEANNVSARPLTVQ
ncbi:MAG TPA: Ig-like domain-containing protein, partial [Vicinamibacteria bacterium]|nr:Ig-like domain-containing protein [Vicinamibacteria bacterium]